MTIGKYLRTLREAEGVSRERLARRADIATHTLWRIETDLSQPQLDTLVKLAAALNVTVDDVLGGAVNESAENVRCVEIDTEWAVGHSRNVTVGQ